MSGIFKRFLNLKEANETLHQPHIVSADPPIKFADDIIRIAEAFKNAKEIVISKQVDPQGGEKPITLKNRKVYATGDIVSGYLVDQPWNNFVLVTDAHPDESYKICQKIKNVTDLKKTGKGVSFNYNNANMAIDTLASKSQNDKISYTTEIYEDAKNGRNLFTINALYYDIIAEKIIDPLGGISDLRKKHIRFYSDDDKVMTLKNMVKFCIIASKLTNPKITAEDKNLSKKVKVENNEDKIVDVFMEGLKMFDNDKVSYFKYLKEMGLDSYIFGDLKVSPIPEAMTGNPPPPTFIASALIDNDNYKISTTLNALGFDKSLIRDVVFLVNLKKVKKYTSTMSSLTEKQIQSWVANNCS